MEGLIDEHAFPPIVNYKVKNRVIAREGHVDSKKNTVLLLRFR